MLPNGKLNIVVDFSFLRFYCPYFVFLAKLFILSNIIYSVKWLNFKYFLQLFYFLPLFSTGKRPYSVTKWSKYTISKSLCKDLSTIFSFPITFTVTLVTGNLFAQILTLPFCTSLYNSSLITVSVEQPLIYLPSLLNVPFFHLGSLPTVSKSNGLPDSPHLTIVSSFTIK